MNCSIRIVQWNARSAVSNKNSLLHFLMSNNVDIALISETWFKPDTQICFSGYNIVRKDRADGYGGCAILIRKKFYIEEIKPNFNLHDKISLCGVEITMQNKH